MDDEAVADAVDNPVDDGAMEVRQGSRVALGETMRALRRRGDLSQRQLAALAGVPASTVARIESGFAQDPRFRTVERLLAAGGLALSIIGRPGAWWVEGAAPGTELVDAAGRRYPAHLDVREVNDPRDWSGAWWAHEYTLPPRLWPVQIPAYSFDLCRAERNRRRRRVLAATGMRIEVVDGLPEGVWQLLARTRTGEVIGEVRALRWRPPGVPAVEAEEQVLLDGFAVVPDCRRAGVGGRLLAAMVETLRTDGVSKVHVLDEAGSTLGAFWRRRGFRPPVRTWRWTGTLSQPASTAGRD